MDRPLNTLIVTTIHHLLSPSQQFEPTSHLPFQAQHPLLEELSALTQTALLPKKTVLNALYKQAQRSTDKIAPQQNNTTAPQASPATHPSHTQQNTISVNLQDELLIAALERLRSKNRGFSPDSKIIRKK